MAGFAVYTSQYGPIRVDWNDGAITGLRIVTQSDNAADGPGEPTELTDLAFHELERYFAGDLRQFTVPIAFTYGTPFQQAVWRALLQIPYGETRTYAQIAEAEAVVLEAHVQTPIFGKMAVVVDFAIERCVEGA